LRVSACTLGHYAAELERFAAWGGGPSSSAGEVDCYLAGRKLGGLGASGLGGAVCALKSFFRFVGSASAAHLRAPRVKPGAQRTVDEDEVSRVLACIDTSTSGLRTSEVCRLRLADLDVERGLFTVIVKGGQSEFGVFHPYTGQLVAAWLAVRDRVAQPSVDTVFVSVARSRKMRGKALTRQAPKLLCRRLAARAGVKPFTLHALRRSFAVLLLAAGCPQSLAMDAGRWKSEEVFHRYVRAARLRLVLQYSPVARLMGVGGDGPVVT
jgi:integrase